MKGFRIYLALAALLLLFVLVAGYNQRRPVNWSATYLKEDKIPFGTFVLQQQLGRIFPDSRLKISRQRMSQTLKEQPHQQAVYLLIAANAAADSVDYQELLKFIQRGNQVLIAAGELSPALSAGLKLQLSSPLNADSGQQTRLRLVSPSLPAGREFAFDKGIGAAYFSKLDTARAIILGKNQKDQVNFVCYRFGKGALYLLNDPLLLSNYALLKPEGAAYAESVLSFLPAGTALIRDEYYTRGQEAETSPLKVIFKYDALRHAYLLSLAGLLIFVLFEMKRRQRIIPVIAPLQNSSMEFVQLVGRLYDQQHDNADLAAKMIRYFSEHLRSAYQLNTTLEDDALARAIQQKTGAPETLVSELFVLTGRISGQSRVTDAELTALHTCIEKFYTLSP